MMLRNRRYGITVEPGVGKRVRDYSHRTGKKMYAVVADAIKEYLDRVDPQKETLGSKD